MLHGDQKYFTDGWLLGSGYMVYLSHAKVKLVMYQLLCAQKKINFESCYIKPNLDCDYTFQIDLASNGYLFQDAKRFRIDFSVNTLTH